MSLGTSSGPSATRRSPGAGLVPVWAGTGILGTESTPFFPRTEFSGVLSGGDTTHRFSFIGLPTFTVRILLIVLVISTVRMDMAMERQGEGEGFAAD